MAAALAVLVLVRDSRSFAHRAFAAGMFALALESALTGLSIQAESIETVILWQRIRLAVAAFIPPIWLLFSLSFTREDYGEFLKRMRWLIAASFGVPLLLGVVFNSSLLGEAGLSDSSTWLFRLSWSGYLLQIFILLGVVAILVTLERTFRASRGHMRWQIKFLILGLGSLFAVRIYTGSQMLLFRSLDTGLEVVNSGTLLVAGVLILRSILRLRLLNVAFYPSHAFLYGSFTVVLVGVYFIAVGVLANLVRYFNGGQSFALKVFFVFVAFLGLSVLLLSDRLRHRMKHFISTQLKRPQYDYRKEWTKFTEKTSTITDVKDLCMTVARMISDTLEVLSVTVWLLDEPQGRMKPGGSTVFSETGVGHRIPHEAEGQILQAMKEMEMPVDLDDPKIPWASDVKKLLPDSLPEARIRYCVPLSAGGNLLGLMTLGERVEYEAFSFEEFDLLKTIADQTAASLLNLKLSEDLRKAKEMEAFQSMSAFMIHDLKNLASSISLTVENLPVHFDNPEFRKDALRIMSQSVGKITGMCSSLSLLSKKLELSRAVVELSDLVRDTLRQMAGSIKVALLEDLHPVPGTLLDKEQFGKVLTNLILNACEATADGGEICITTRKQEGWVLLQVSDNGCGMSKEFIEHSLFRPFKSTKKGGMGIGLFHSKMIVEAHQGRIEVQSEEGKGTTFSVFLPIGQR